MHGAGHCCLACNGVCNKENLRPPHHVAEQIKVYVKMIELQFFSQDTSNRRETELSSPRWSPPPGRYGLR
jgi:hypothetical protein